MAPIKKSFAMGVVARALIAACICAFSGAAALAAGTPEKTIDALNAKLLDTMKQAQQLGVQGRFNALAPVLAKTYDIASMSRMAVGQSWETLQPEQQAAVTDAFGRMMFATYAKRFDGFSGEVVPDCRNCRACAGRQDGPHADRAKQRQAGRDQLSDAENGTGLESRRRLSRWHHQRARQSSGGVHINHESGRTGCADRLVAQAGRQAARGALSGLTLPGSQVRERADR